MKKRILLFVLILITSCSPKPSQCISDSDCVPASCCHPDSAVNKAYAPDCRMVDCSAECRPGTLDCGQGEIKCVNNKCTVIIHT